MMPRGDASRQRVSGWRGAGNGGDCEPDCGAAPVLGARASRRHGDLDATDADAHECTDLEQLETNGAAGGFRELGVVQADPAQGAEQHISHGMEPQAQLVGAHRGGRGAIRIEIELALLDAVLHVAAGAVDLLVKVLWLALVAPERGDYKARIGLSLRALGLGHDPTLAAPARARRPHEALEAALRPAGAPALRLGLREFVRDHGNQPLSLLQPKHEAHAVRLAPGHQLLTRKARVSAQQNARARPTDRKSTRLNSSHVAISYAVIG